MVDIILKFPEDISDNLIREEIGMQDITTIILGISMILLAAAFARLNDKLDKQIRKFQRFEDALRKNATGQIRNQDIVEESREEIYQK